MSAQSINYLLLYPNPVGVAYGSAYIFEDDRRLAFGPQTPKGCRHGINQLNNRVTMIATVGTGEVGGGGYRNKMYKD